MAALPQPAPPLLVKIAPDLTDEDKADVAAVCLGLRVSGIIATNTTIARPPELRGAARGEAGGLSGHPLFAASTAVLADLYRLTEGRIPLIGVGRSEEHTSELQSLMRNSYAVFCLKKKKTENKNYNN